MRVKLLYLCKKCAVLFRNNVIECKGNKCCSIKTPFGKKYFLKNDVWIDLILYTHVPAVLNLFSEIIFTILNL